MASDTVAHDFGGAPGGPGASGCTLRIFEIRRPGLLVVGTGRPSLSVRSRERPASLKAGPLQLLSSGTRPTSSVPEAGGGLSLSSLAFAGVAIPARTHLRAAGCACRRRGDFSRMKNGVAMDKAESEKQFTALVRSEERRVGKECR